MAAAAIVAAGRNGTHTLKYGRPFGLPMSSRRAVVVSGVTTSRDNLIAWLRDAHAMEEQAETMLNARYQRLENYPALKARIGQHIEEIKQHATLVQGSLDRVGNGQSMMKDIAGKLTAMAQGLGVILAADEVMKGALAGHTFEHMEIASYRILIPTAEYIGDTDTVTACKRIFAEELAMAKWLEDNAGSVTQEFLRRDEGDLES